MKVILSGGRVVRLTQIVKVTRQTVRWQGVDGRPRLKLTYKESLELP